MKVKELIERLEKFNPEMDVRVQPKGIFEPTETIGEVVNSVYPCPTVCILIKGE
jgi:hypothetical protein